MARKKVNRRKSAGRKRGKGFLDFVKKVGNTLYGAAKGAVNVLKPTGLISQGAAMLPGVGKFVAPILKSQGFGKRKRRSRAVQPKIIVIKPRRSRRRRGRGFLDFAKKAINLGKKVAENLKGTGLVSKAVSNILPQGKFTTAATDFLKARGYGRRRGKAMFRSQVVPRKLGGRMLIN